MLPRKEGETELKWLRRVKKTAYLKERRQNFTDEKKKCEKERKKAHGELRKASQKKLPSHTPCKLYFQFHIVRCFMGRTLGAKFC